MIHYNFKLVGEGGGGGQTMCVLSACFISLLYQYLCKIRASHGATKLVCSLPMNFYEEGWLMAYVTHAGHVHDVTDTDW